MKSSNLNLQCRAAVLLLVALPCLIGYAETTGTNDLLNMSLQQLMEVRITINKGTPEELADSSAAVSVITQEDIQRSGVTTIPDALRLVPGLDVARLDAHTWAVSARGFNDVFANKLLVMIDGRTVYTPLFSGVFWDMQNTLMEDIDRIEVVRGPGATLWGANAVNGVINIITKSAADTEGVLVSGGAGSQEGEFASVRYGTAVADGVFLKGYAKYFDRDASDLLSGEPADDAWSLFQSGFRLDMDRTNQNIFTLQGDVYTGQEHEIYMVEPKPLASLDLVSGGNVLGRWVHEFSDDSALNVRLSYDRTIRDTAIFAETQDTYDLEAQHDFTLADWNQITWGGEYRYVAGDIRQSPYVGFTDPDRDLNYFSAFLQDGIQIVQTNVVLTLGSKFEHNDFTGFEIQPSARLAWTGANQTVWGSVSRAVRTPSQAESDIILKTGPVTIMGNPDMLSEELLAYELGYRAQPFSRLNLDVTGFYNHYDRLRSESLGVTATGPMLTAENDLSGRSFGGEISSTFQPSTIWRLTGGYSYCRVEIQGSDLADTEGLLEGSSPRSQAFARSSLDLPYNISLDATVRYVDDLNFPVTPGDDYYQNHIPSYVTYDLRLAWRPCAHVECSIVGENLGQARHLEFAPTYIPTEQTAVVRSVYGKVTFKF